MSILSSAAPASLRDKFNGRPEFTEVGKKGLKTEPGAAFQGSQQSLLFVSLMSEVAQVPRATELHSPLCPPAPPFSSPCSCHIILGIETLSAPRPGARRLRTGRVQERESPSTAISTALLVGTLYNNIRPQEGLGRKREFPSDLETKVWASNQRLFCP